MSWAGGQKENARMEVTVGPGKRMQDAGQCCKKGSENNVLGQGGD